MTAPGMTAVSVDAVVLRGTSDGTQVLLHRRTTDPFRGDWALPGVLLRSGERITDAAVRAAGKAFAQPGDVSGAGQLIVFDEPNRDPRGPTLSIATWVTVNPTFEPADQATAHWADWDQLPALAFDHGRILTDVRPILAGKLWTDLAFTRALTGPVFGSRTALKITESLTGAEVDRGNLNREIKRVAERAEESVRSSWTGRPSTVWRWPAEAE
ncbi:hypothetical protein ACT17_22595 [Mycolicibacterium conceptionense]|uniref:Nudix hydrolase domain-containing protein n=1 Tax=Mycolicibacterium conceptionense TaxID=451644 RepID=A0A0J8U320_9MYCO|nr:NUDIX domain-containing protein [Mycolicibacterium conceptionense]KMV15901.1 hypothetical protein ACT17_22595 [Mycolicibacterium conceptionense]